MAWIAQQLLVAILITTTRPQWNDVVDHATNGDPAVAPTLLAQPMVPVFDALAIAHPGATALTLYHTSR
jgi:hypothetical protein